MSAQLGASVTLGYTAQGGQQAGSAVLLSYSPPASVSRKLVADFEAPWGAGTVHPLDIRAPMHRTQPLQLDARAPWHRAHVRHAASRQPWGVAQATDAVRRNKWTFYAGRPLALSSIPWGVSQRQDHVGVHLWDHYARHLSLQPAVQWGVAHKQDAENAGPWGRYAVHLARSAGASWVRATVVDREQWHPWTQFSRPLEVAWGVVIPDVDQVFTLIVPVRKVYMVINNATLTRVDGNIALPCTSLTLSLDVDSWAWGFSAALPGRVLADLDPASGGAPVELEAMVNGTAFRVLVESISRERTFGKNDIRVQGRGKTALLDGPYAPVQSFTNALERTAQQLMGDALTVNGVPLDWALNWGLTDWLVPANAFAHQGSTISALNTIAQAAGGYIQPHASLQTLNVLARYPVAPWDWGTVTPDFELPADVTTREGIEWVERARYNRVFVSGQQSGILGQVTRAGTAGDLLAPMVTDALITTAAAARQRGISVLGNTGRQANVSLRLPVLAETGVITPGKFVRYVDAGTTRTGLVRSVNVDTNFPQVWQSIGVETHV